MSMLTPSRLASVPAVRGSGRVAAFAPVEGLPMTSEVGAPVLSPGAEAHAASSRAAASGLSLNMKFALIMICHDFQERRE